MYVEYKANRPKMPDEIAYQIPILKEIIGMRKIINRMLKRSRKYMREVVSND